MYEEHENFMTQQSPYGSLQQKLPESMVIDKNSIQSPSLQMQQMQQMQQNDDQQIQQTKFVKQLKDQQIIQRTRVKKRVQIKGNQSLYNNTKSKQRLKKLQEQQQYLSQTFKIDNFYQKEKLDINNLKFKLNQIKPKNLNLQKQRQENNSTQLTNRNHTKNRNRNSNQQTLVPLNKRLINHNHQNHNNNNTKHDNRNLSFYHLDNKRTKNYSTIAQRSSHITNIDKKQQNNYKQGHRSSERYDEQIIQQKTGRNRKINKILPYNPQKQKSDSMKDSMIIPKIYTIGHRKKQPKQITIPTKTKQNSNRYMSFLGNASPKSSTNQNSINNFINTRLEPIIRKNIIKFEINDIQMLQKFETNITQLWNLYQKLSNITNKISTQQIPSQSRSQTHHNSSKNNLHRQLTSPQFLQLLVEYRMTVCSTKLQFIMLILQNCMQTKHAKIILQSRILQNLSIIYIFFYIIQNVVNQNNNSNNNNEQTTNNKNRNQIDISLLVNFVGICSNNLLLILRILTLTHTIDQSLTISSTINGIFIAINKFQIQSYNGELKQFKDIVLRIQHNNSLATMVQNKLNYRLQDRKLHAKCINQFLRGVIIDGLRSYYRQTDRNHCSIQLLNKDDNAQIYKPLFEYSFYIFEYLSYYLHNQNYLGLFPQEIQIAPQPYLPLQDTPGPNCKQFTIVINVKNVLILQSSKAQKIFIRAHTQYFIRQMSKKCNIVLWSDQMPCQIDPYFDLLQQQQENADGSRVKLYRLYQHHCRYQVIQEKRVNLKRSYFKRQNQTKLAFIKDMNQIPLPSSKYLILDYKFDSYYTEELDCCLNMDWRGEPDNNGLKILANYLQPILREGIDLGLGLQLMRPRLQASLRETKIRGIRRKGNLSKHKK